MREQRHHYIPEFYLKQWVSSPDQKLVEFCRRHHNKVIARRTHPGGTGYIRGLYSIQGAPPHLKDVLEDKYLSVADGVAANSLRAMVDYRMVPTGPQKSSWTRFMMSLLYRTPEGVARSIEMVGQYFAEKHIPLLRLAYDEQKAPDDPETFEEYMAIHGASMTSRTAMQHLLDIIESKHVRQRIMGMRWHLGVMNHQKHSLLTSDRPLIMTTGGIGYPNSHIIMPLSPRHILIMANTDEEVEKIKALSQGQNLIQLLNDRIVRQARKFVYDMDDRQLRFVDNRLGEKATCSPFE